MNTELHPPSAATRLWLLLVGGGLVLAVTAFRLHYLVTVVVGTSMEPTLATGDLLLVNRHAYDDAAPRRGDIVICRSGGDLLVKRVVGLPGEELRMIRGTLFVNGQALREPYVVKRGFLDISRGRVPAGHVVVMGDNRDFAHCLFIFAIVPWNHILGKVVYSLRLHLPSWNQRSSDVASRQPRGSKTDSRIGATWMTLCPCPFQKQRLLKPSRTTLAESASGQVVVKPGETLKPGSSACRPSWKL